MSMWMIFRWGFVSHNDLAPLFSKGFLTRLIENATKSEAEQIQIRAMPKISALPLSRLEG
jgi:hypothetical protein